MELDNELLETTVKRLLARGKGLLAADESSKSCQKRLTPYTCHAQRVPAANTVSF